MATTSAPAPVTNEATTPVASPNAPATPAAAAAITTAAPAATAPAAKTTAVTSELLGTPIAKEPVPAAAAPPKDMVAPPASPTVHQNNIVKFSLIALSAIWGMFGFAAFVMSLVCLGRSGSTGEKIFGVLLAMFMGPFYFIYFYASGTYCKVLPPSLF